MKYFDIKISKKRKHSGFHILPMLVLNISYKTLTFALFRFVLEIRYNDYNSECNNCGAVRKNKIDAENHCIDNVF